MGFWGNMFGAFGGAASSPTPYTKNPAAPTSDTLGGSPAPGTATGAPGGAVGAAMGGLKGASPMLGGVGAAMGGQQQLWQKMLQQNPQLQQLQGGLGQGGGNPGITGGLGFKYGDEPTLQQNPGLQQARLSDIEQPGGRIQKKTTLFGNRRFSRSRR